MSLTSIQNFLTAIATTIVLAACGGGNELSYDNSVDVEVEGLASDAEITLQLNEGESIVASGPGQHAFTQRVPVGDTYNVSVTQQPGNDQRCTLRGNTGTMTAQTTTVVAECATAVEVIVAGLEEGQQLLLQLNDGEVMTATGSGRFLFEKRLPVSSQYTVSLQPGAPQNLQVCSFQESSNTGTMTDRTATVKVACSTAVEVTVEGLEGGQVVIQLDGEESIEASAPGTFIFTKRLPVGTNYTVAVANQPRGFQWCTIANSTGTVTPERVRLTATCSVSGAQVTTLNYAAGSSSFADGPLVSAGFDAPSHMAYDAQNNLFIFDRKNYLIRKVDVNGNVSTVAGVRGQSGLTDGPIGVSTVTANLRGFAFDKNGDMHFTDVELGLNSQGLMRVQRSLLRKLDSNGHVSTIATFVSVVPGAVVIPSFDGLAFDSKGNLYITDNANKVIYKYDLTTKNISIFAGSAGSYSYDRSLTFDGGVGVGRFGIIDKLIADANDNLYVADGITGFRKIDPTGYISSVLDPVYRVNNTSTLARDSYGNVYLGGFNTGRSQVTKVTPSGKYNVLAGVGTQGYRDGLGTQALFNGVRGIVIDRDGNLIVADNLNNRIRKIVPVQP